MSEGFPLFSTLTETTLSSSAVACLNANVRKGGPGKRTAVPVWLLQVDTGIGFLHLDKGHLGPRQANSGCGHAGENPGRCNLFRLRADGLGKVALGDAKRRMHESRSVG